MDGDKQYPMAGTFVRASIAIVIVTSLASTVVTLMAAMYPALNATVQALVDAVWIIPARQWARGSSYPELSAVYYLCCSPVFVAAVVGVTAKVGFPVVNKFAPNFTRGLRVRSAIVSLGLIAASIALLVLFDGADSQYLHLGTNLGILLALGWAFFAGSACLFSLGLVGLCESLFPSGEARI
jgi:hypothetical protein